MRHGILPAFATIIVAGLSFLVPQEEESKSKRPSGTGGSPGVLESPQAKYVVTQDLPLFASPTLNAEEPQAKLASGTPVSVAEERQGWSRVVIWGWVPSESLSEEPAATVSGFAPPVGSQAPEKVEPESESAEGETPPQPDLDDQGKPLMDVSKASRISVTSRTLSEDESEGSIGLGLGLTDPRGRSIGFEETALTFHVSLFGKRELPGGTTRGRKIHETRFTLEHWKEGLDETTGKCRIPFSDIKLEADDSETGIIVVRTRLPDGRFLFGRSYEVSLKASSDDQ